MTTANQSSSGTLRHRRKSPSSSETQPKNNENTSNNDEETEPLLVEEKDFDDHDDDPHNDGYTLTPLIQRSLLMRLDVGPFLIGYLLLIYLDYQTVLKKNTAALEHHSNSNNLKILLHPVTLAFAFLLISHIMLVLMQQWNVHVRRLVGFQRGAQHVDTKNKSTTSNCTAKAEAVISSWTHCLVEVGTSSLSSSSSKSSSFASTNSSDTSADVGIAPVTIRSIPKLNCKVAIVNFHDITFRCPTMSKSLDQDVTLWNSKQMSTTSENDDTNIINNYYTRTKLSFHRVRFPVDLPVAFYESWRGHPTLDSVVQCQHLYGTNATILELPTFMELLSDQVVAPFFLFQLFCVALWSLDEYWYYAIFTLLALLSFESTVAYNRLNSLQRLRNASRQNNHRIWVHRKGFHSASTLSSSSPWLKITAQEVVPGDLVSLSSEPESLGRFSSMENRRDGSSSAQHETVPADVLLLKGNAVVDEALLTGESVPQIKVPFDSSTASSTTSATHRLDIQDHKESILFGGTVLVTADFGTLDDQDSIHDITKGKIDEQAEKMEGGEIPRPPDGGVVGLVLRTGFETAQGSLLRTIAHSSKSVDGVHTRDTFVFIFLLVCCAIASASLVLQDGWSDVTRNRFRLTLHVIIIITSVVPPELPMELSLAVTNSVTDLMKRCQVFCTEHYRIPWAGLVDVCCFDKTGTLTSDQMRLKGIRLFANDDLEYLDEEKALINPGEQDPEVLPWSTVRVMAGCHSLALRASRGTSGSLIGDPLETAVLKDTGYQLVGNNMLIPSRAMPGRPKSITILHRFAFSSQLKRMTVLVTEENSAHESNKFSKNVVWSLTKGAPETIYQLLSPDSIPTDYDDVYTYHMSRGRRVLSMGYRCLGSGHSIRSLKEKGRDSFEEKLTFAGFLVLDCPLKSDSKSVILEIKKSDHRVVMITGDAVLTAAEVARQVGIIPTARGAGKHTTYWLQSVEDNMSEGVRAHDPLSRFSFVPLMSKSNLTTSVPESLKAMPDDICKLQAMNKSGEASFCLTGDMLMKVAASAIGAGSSEPNGETKLSTLSSKGIGEKSLLMHSRVQNVLKNLVQVISVFARHAPHQKEAIVAAYNLSGHFTLYCGDGTNDTPSLKRAHVGISIISAPEAEFKQRKANASISRLKAENKRERKAQKKEGKKAGSSSNSSRARSMEESLRLLREAQEDIDQVELGDASVASPFTSKQVSIVCCKNVLQQGRCTLVTMLQIYKILGVNCLVNAMVLSTLSIHGVKQGDRQLTVLGTVVAVLFLFVTRAKPLGTLSSARPPPSVLCAQALISIGLQFAIHFGTILIACWASLSKVDPFDPSIVADGPFNPNVLNTCTFMLTVLATINTFAVNYRGRPYTEDLKENTLLMRSLLACYISLFLCAFEAFPPLNDLLQLSSFPSAMEMAVEGEDSTLESFFDIWLAEMLRIFDFPGFICILMLVDTVLSFLVEKMIIRTFEGQNVR